MLLAAYYLLLHAHGAGPDLAVGFPVNVRSQQAQHAIGYHVNIVPLRVRIDPAETFRGFSRRVRDLFFEAIAHADVKWTSCCRRSSAPVRPGAPRCSGTCSTTCPSAGERPRASAARPPKSSKSTPGTANVNLEFVILPSAQESRI